MYVQTGSSKIQTGSPQIKMELATKAHLGKVYMVAAGGCFMTFAGSLIGAFCPITHPLINIGLFLVCIALMINVAAADTMDDSLWSFVLFSYVQGMFLGGLWYETYLDVFVFAVMATFLVFGTVTVAALYSPPDRFVIDSVGGTLFNLLVLLLVSQLFFPDNAWFATDVILGACVFAGYLFVDTVKIIHELEESKSRKWRKPCNPVWHAMAIYLDLLNLFLRILLAASEDKKKEDSKKD